MSQIRTMLGVSAGALMLLTTVAASADGVLSAVGATQGKFKGGAPRDITGELVTRVVEHGPTAPKDYNGIRLAGGKAKIHEPIVVTLKVDADMLLLWKNAMAKNEKLKVDITMFGDATGVVGEFHAGGKEQAMYTISLTGAVVEKAEDSKPDATHYPNEKDAKASYLRLSLDYETIKLKHQALGGLDDTWF
jgi:type VI secretion system Hcp family effector